MSAETTVAGRVLQAAGEAGARVAFGLPGVHNLAFWRAAGAGPQLVNVRHEQTTVYAADGLARATGGLGLALTTTGPGAANAVAAFGEAAASGSPVLLVASEVATSVARPGVRRGALHDSRDQAGMFAPLAKAVFRPRTVADACAAIGTAIGTALDWPRGPAYVDIPTDLLRAAGPRVVVPQPRRPAPEPAAVERLAGALRSAASVVLWAGGGVVQSCAGPALGRLAERLGAPVLTTYGARGILPPDHPCLVGLPPHEPEVGTLLAGADLMLAVGSELDGMMTRNWTLPLPPVLAAINCDPAELTKNYRPDPAVPGDARETLEGLLDGDLGPGAESPGPALRRVRAEAWARIERDPRTATAAAFVAALNAATTPDTVLLADMAVGGYWAAGYATVRRPRGLQYPMGWGTLGYALPAAVGAGFAGDCRPLVVCGDGGLAFAIGELATLAQEHLPVTILVLDDGGYGMLRFDQRQAGDEERGVDLHTPDIPGLAAAFGVPATVVDGIGPALTEVLRAGLHAKQPNVVVLRERLFPPRTTSPRWRE